MRRNLAVFRLTTSGLLIALSIILQRIFVLPQGPTFYRISLANVPIIFASLLMGPVYGGIVGGLSDFIGATVLPSGTFFVWPFISATLYGVLPALIIMLLKKIPVKIKTILFHIVALSLYVFVVLYILKNNKAFYGVDENGERYLEFSPLFRITSLIVLTLVGVAVSVAITWLQIKNKGMPINEITGGPVDLAFALLLTRIILDVGYATVWKHSLWQIDFVISFFFHTIILLVLVPLETFFLTLISKPLSSIKSRF